MPACTQPVLPFGAYVMSIIKSMYKTGDRIQIGCKTGFKQSGNPYRICMSGRWTAFQFQCKGISCGVPPSINNGFKQFNSTGYNATVRYWCKNGFTLNDDKTKRCTAKKRWEKPTPKCLPDCKNPVILNAFVDNPKSKYASGDRVTFKCKKGYQSQGVPSALCFMGRWKSISFICIKKI
ncbi:complement factor H-related protein 1 [Exaiptasia diaphana]|uniref:Sushi domain-containing protein n=1 Tax=Exaiptasia diaphana TaxID=2652724 RepID=A0A913XZ54_EXADI|nr:complement factor H-related protein 1 [Exaiptasia diaphana]